VRGGEGGPEVGPAPNTETDACTTGGIGTRYTPGTDLGPGPRLATADEWNSATDLLGDTAVTKSVTNPALSDA